MAGGNGNNNRLDTLRHRRGGGGGGERREKETVAVEEVTSTTGEEVGSRPRQHEEPVSQCTDRDDDPSSSSSSSSYTLVPLRERSLVTRLDVGPFYLIYMILVWLDYNTRSDEEANQYHDDGGTTTTTAASTSTIGDPWWWIMTLFFLSSRRTTLTIAFATALLIHLSLVLWAQWSVRVRALIGYRRCTCTNNNTKNDNNDEWKKWTHCLVMPASAAGSTTGSGGGVNHGGGGGGAMGICPVNYQSIPKNTTTSNSRKQEGEQVAVCTFQDRTFRYCPSNVDDEDLDVRLWANNDSSKDNKKDGARRTSRREEGDCGPRFRSLRYPDSFKLDWYGTWKGLSDLDAVNAAAAVYGPNTCLLELPSFWELLSEQCTAPFFLFQMFCVLLWSLDEYWYYAIYTAAALILFESTMAYNRLKSVQRLHTTAAAAGSGGVRDTVWVHRGTGLVSNAHYKRANLDWQWMSIPVCSLCPGDVICLTSSTTSTVPADILLLEGTAVTDEALLTGESIPQLKRALDTTTTTTTTSAETTTTKSSSSPRLDANEPQYKESILFGGTGLLVTTSSSSTPEQGGDGDDQSASSRFASTAALPIASSQEGGGGGNNVVIGMVLRTGFETTQGNLLRTMAHSGKAVDGIHNRDTFWFLFLLCGCALCAAATVLQAGINDPRRNRFRLLLHVILIVTAVIPPELPMELSLAVTNSVADLMKRCNVYCTELYRIPLAGQVTVCCFDKTGTLTSDEMRLRGVRLFNDDDNDKNNNKITDTTTTTTNTETNPSATDSSPGKKKKKKRKQSTAMTREEEEEDARLIDVVAAVERQQHQEEEGDDNAATSCSPLPWPVLRVMVACHSLALTTTTHQQQGRRRNNDGATNNSRAATTLVGDPLERAVFEGTGYSLIHANTVIPTSPSLLLPAITILHRFAFDSKLARMTVLATETGSSSKYKNVLWALTKGAPEVMQKIMKPDTVPPDYERVVFHHMSRGRRVLAMAYKRVAETSTANATVARIRKERGRDWIESDLHFAGLLLLDCPLKADSKPVLEELTVTAGLRAVMITGDALLTAAEVARQVGIINNSKRRDEQQQQQDEQQQQQDEQQQPVMYTIQESTTTTTSNPSLPSSLLKEEDVLSHFDVIPLIDKYSNNNNGSGKTSTEETVARPLTGASLRQFLEMVRSGEASFCLAGSVLARIASLAVQRHQKGSANNGAAALDEKHVLLHPAAIAVLSRLVPLIRVFARHNPHQKEAVVAALNHSDGGAATTTTTLYCGDGTNDVGALKRSHVGISIVSAPGVESKQRHAARHLKRAAKEQRKNKQKTSTTKSKSKKKNKGTTRGGGSSSAWEDYLRELSEAQDELDQVQLGDASVAAPFTSRAVSIVCCKDVIQQGRCTLVTMLSIYKILGINCLVNALVLSTLFLHGVKQGDRQLTVLGIAIAALFYFVTRATPLPALAPESPPASVLTVSTLSSIGFQFCIHLAAILVAASCALAFVDPYDPSLVPDGPFNPNVLNTSTFLLTCCATINTFAVNYRGRPYMGDLRENKLLLRSLQICYATLFVCALEVFPPLNDLLQLTPFPDVTSTAQVNGGGDDNDVDFLGVELHPTLSGSSTTLVTGMSMVFTTLVRLVGFPVFVCGLMVVDTVLVFAAENLIRKTLGG